MTTKQIEKSIIKKTPDVCGGDACIGNRRIPVWQIIEAKRLGFSDCDLMARYEQPLTQTEFDAALEYYERNREEIDEAIRDNEAVMHEEIE